MIPEFRLLGVSFSGSQNEAANGNFSRKLHFLHGLNIRAFFMLTLKNAIFSFKNSVQKNENCVFCILPQSTLQYTTPGQKKEKFPYFSIAGTGDACDWRYAGHRDWHGSTVISHLEPECCFHIPAVWEGIGKCLSVATAAAAAYGLTGVELAYSITVTAWRRGKRLVRRTTRRVVHRMTALKTGLKRTWSLRL